jgi:hypothetical protein
MNDKQAPAKSDKPDSGIRNLDDFLGQIVFKNIIFKRFTITHEHH